MKKKIAGLLAAMMVLTMGATTVFASQSPTSQETEEQKAQQLRDSVSNVDTSQEGVTVEVGKVDSNEVANANTQATSYSEDAEVLGMVELKSDKDFSKGVTLTFYVAGVKKGDNIRILHKLSNGTWEVIVPYVGDGFVRATFYSLSPIAIVKYPAGVSVASTQTVPQTEGNTQTNETNSETDENNNENSNTNESSNTNDNSNDTASDSSSSSKSDAKANASANANVNVNVNNDSNNRPTSGGSGAATSPKTGQSAPVLPILAVIALMGMAVKYGKKAHSL